MPKRPNWLRPASLALSALVVLTALYPVFTQAARIFA